MELKRLDNDERWNLFVDASPQGCLFNYTWYLRSLGLDYEIWIVERSGEICAGTIVCRFNKAWTFGPFQKYMGVLYAEFEGNNYQRITNQRKAAALLAAKTTELPGYSYFFHPSFVDWLPFYRHGYSADTYYTYRINLNGMSPDGLLNLCAPRLRTKIRKASSEVTLQIKDNTSVEEFYRVYQNAFHRHGNPMPIEHDKFKTLCNGILQNTRLQLYSLHTVEGNITSVLGIAYDRKAAYLLFNGFDSQFREEGHNELLIYRAICQAAEHATIFDFEGSMLPGVESFYRQFGGDFTPYFRIYKNSFLRQARMFLAGQYHSVKAKGSNIFKTEE